MWDVKNDNLFIKSNLEKPGKKTKKTEIKITVISELNKVQVRPQLTIRSCLSLHSKPYDPLGLILPIKMIGNLLFRNSLRFMKKEGKGKIPWDDPIED